MIGKKTPKILVIGDLIRDVYVEGTVRVSREAPVQILRAQDHHERPGGAAGVAAMAKALGAEVTLACAASHSNDCFGMHGDLTWIDPNWSVPVKTRFYATGDAPGLLLRVDEEENSSWTHARDWTARVIERIPDFDVVLISDYGKGTLTPKILREIIDCAGSATLIVDPSDPGKVLHHYAGVNGIRCTERQFSRNYKAVEDFDGWILATNHLGGCLFEPDIDGSLFVSGTFPARKGAIVDPLGCGDQMLATLGFCCGSGMGLKQSCHWAMTAAGLQVEQRGIQPVGQFRLMREMGEKQIQQDQCKLLRAECDDNVVFANGCFDLLHEGHIRLLLAARKLGGVLVVGLNSDASVRNLKGLGRPKCPLDTRILSLEALQCVDHIVVFDSEEELLEIIRNLRPQFVVKGEEYQGTDVPGAKELDEWGGVVYFVPQVPGVSTTRLVALKSPVPAT